MPDTSSTEAILCRLSDTLDTDNNRALAEVIGVPSTTISTWKSRGTIPIKVLMEIAEERDLSLDYLLLGKPRTDKSEEGIQPINLVLYGEVLKALRNDYLTYHSIDPPGTYASMTAKIYNQACRVSDEQERSIVIKSTICILNLRRLEERLDDWEGAKDSPLSTAAKSKHLVATSISKTKALISHYQQELDNLDSQ